METLDPFSDYYQRELDYLRNAGRKFARQYPKVAKRLDFSEVESSDPHVERLLESFAFLTARLQRTIDDDFPRITSALIGMLYPPLQEPVPSFAISQFKTSPKVGKLTSIYSIPRGTMLNVRDSQDTPCYFQTCYPIDLAPVNVTAVEVVSTDQDGLRERTESIQAFRIRVESYSGTFGSIGLNKLRFHIAGNRLLQNSIYESIFTVPDAPIIRTDHGWSSLLDDSLQDVGFNVDENLQPLSAHRYAGHRLIQEYFCFPEKFLFFDLKDLGRYKDVSSFDIYLPISKDIPMKTTDVSVRNFLLGCTPIVNLFSKISEPLRLDQRSNEYRLIADHRREKTTEIHSIQAVHAAVEDIENPQVIYPYFSFEKHGGEEEARAFWNMRRVPTINTSQDGTDAMISFVDLDFNPQLPASQVIYAHLLCTNRSLAHLVPAGAILQTDVSMPVSEIVCLDRPTPQVYPPQEAKSQWQLIANLSLNQLSLSNDDLSLSALKSILHTYSDALTMNTHPEIDAIQTISTETVSRRILNDSWRGFVRGTKISLTFSDLQKRQTTAFLFSAVLSRFFSLYTAINSYTELEIRKAHQDGYWKKWKPQSGSQELL